MCVCGPLFVTCCCWCVATMITCQPHSPKNYEAKLNPLYKHTNKQNYTHFPASSIVFDTTIWTSDWWTLRYLLFGIIQQLQNCVQASEFWTRGKNISVYSYTVKFLPCLLSNSNAIEGNWLKNWSEFQIFSHGQEGTSLLYDPAWDFELHQSWPTNECRYFAVPTSANYHFYSWILEIGKICCILYLTLLFPVQSSHPNIIQETGNLRSVKNVAKVSKHFVNKLVDRIEATNNFKHFLKRII